MNDMNEIIVKKNKNRRRYSLEISSDGDIIVRTPIRSSKRSIQQFIADHQDWIETQQKKVMAQKAALCDWESPNHMYLHGVKHAVFESDTPVAIIQKNRIHLPVGVNRTKFLCDSAARYLPERCLDIAEMMQLNVTKVKLRTMKSCWGTCSKQAVITLNKALIQVPTWVSDYVMIHECAHIVHFDHSKSFWGLVEQYCDDYKQAKKWLKEHQIVLIKT